MTHAWSIVRTLEEFQAFVSQLDRTRVVAADVETYKNRPNQSNAMLLGLALTGHTPAGEHLSAYIAFHSYNRKAKFFQQFCQPSSEITTFLRSVKLVGWNVPYDKMWIDSKFEMDTEWEADGRILWHLQALQFPDTIITKGGTQKVEPRGYGLKLAQKLILKWRDTNDDALDAHVRMLGGRLDNGDHYMADLDVLAHYACLDTLSTILCYEKLKPFIDRENYSWFANRTLSYAVLLNKASTQGIPVDARQLREAHTLYNNKREEAATQLIKDCEYEITIIENDWKEAKLATYKTERGRETYLAAPERWRRFNPSSGDQRALLIHTMLKFPITARTETGKPKTDRATLASISHPAARTLVSYSEYKKVAEQAETYLKHADNSRIYTSYDVCGTVSGRLAGFRPSVLNMPFSEVDVMKSFHVEEGYVGIHADLASIEPCVLAHYSEDPTLLKVYKHGAGDIYLDLGLDVFLEMEELRQKYNSLAPITSAVKEEFKDVRSVCKIIHLAVSYTGTHVTVAKNLTQAGFPTSKGQAMQLVSRYWSKFAVVKAFNYKIQELYDERGYIRNLTGRIIRVPTIYKKDLMNRLVQSSAHDILILWVLNIVEMFNSNKVDWKFHLPDIHDSASFMIKKGQEELARQCYLDALELVKTQVHMSVPIKCEVKYYTTLAGLKGND